MSIEQLLNEVNQLSENDQWRLVNHLLQTLETKRHHTNWQEAVKATYGILADDPIERPPR